MLDIIEIDAASNTGVDNIRELIDKARFEPNQGKFKIYIIDEVHMLSKWAFNALLKTLEEPPSHVKFILATTEIDKVPETIRSRVQRFDFKKISREDIISRLEFIAQSEGIEYESEALSLIARFAKWWLRDAITLFEQSIVHGKVTKEHITHTFFIIDEGTLGAIVKFIAENNTAAIITTLGKLQERYIDVRLFFEQILFFLKDALYANSESPIFWTYYRIFEGIEAAYGKLKYVPDTNLLLEITLLKLAQKSEPQSIVETPKQETPKKSPSIPEKKEEIIKKIPSTPEKKEENLPSPIISPSRDTKESPITNTSVLSKDFSFAVWLNHIKWEKAVVFQSMKNCQFKIQDTTLTLSFNRKWDFDKVHTPDIENFLAKTLEICFGIMYTVHLVLNEWTPQGNQLAKTADEIF